MNVAAGAGAFIGGVFVASRANASPRQLVLGVLALATVTVASGAAPHLSVLFLLLAITGGCNVAVIATSNAMLQLASADVMRGRVLAVRAVCVLGGMAVGGPITGAITDALGARWGLAVGGFVTYAAAAGYVRHLRRRAADPLATERALAAAAALAARSVTAPRIGATPATEG